MARMYYLIFQAIDRVASNMYTARRRVLLAIYASRSEADGTAHRSSIQMAPISHPLARRKLPLAAYTSPSAANGIAHRQPTERTPVIASAAKQSDTISPTAQIAAVAPKK